VSTGTYRGSRVGRNCSM